MKPLESIINPDPSDCLLISFSSGWFSGIPGKKGKDLTVSFTICVVLILTTALEFFSAISENELGTAEAYV
jgi:hypothetical protein